MPSPYPIEPSADAIGSETLAAFLEDAQSGSAEPFLTLAAAYFAEAARGNHPVSTALTPTQLVRRFQEPMPRAPRPLAEVADRLERDFVSDANWLSHPMAMGHQVSAPLPAAVWADVLISALNQSGSVWEMAPTGNAIEHQVLRWMLDLVGFGPSAGGTFTSGGTEATFAALLAARSRAVPDIWTNGLGPVPPVIVCGEHAHYAVARAAGEMGLGQRSVITVPSELYRMDCHALALTLAQLEAAERKVMAVVATAGSTPTGTFDDLRAIADVCEPRGLWLHVDAAHGASALLSDRHAPRLKGIERAHSVAWDPHKMLLLPVAAGTVLVREERWLEAAYAQKAPYLFQNEGGAAASPAEEEGRVWDQGARSFLCSRRLDAIKLWVALQRYGADGLGSLYDRLCAQTKQLHNILRSRGDFEVLHQPECNILCFRYLGTRDGPGGEDRLDRLNAELRTTYNQSGEGWITTTLLNGRRVLRVTIMNPRTAREHLEALVEGLARQGAALEELVDDPD